MITCNLVGRLGNQLFQMATTICYASKNKLPYCIPKYTVSLTHFPKYFDVKPCCNELPKNLKTYHEQKHSYTEILPQDNIVLNGFFQSEKYFAECRDQILEAFGFSWHLRKGVVSIHLRRGDYLILQDKHPPVSREYIANAIEFMIGRGFNKFRVYSDDIPFCKVEFNLFRGVFNDCEFEFSEGRNVIDDLQDMSCCEHNIISNSTYSWWAAWLNRNPNKIVYAPKIWFGPGNAHLDDKDIIPENWIKK